MGRGNIADLSVTSCGMRHNGWRNGVLAWALNPLPRGVLGTLQHSQSLAGISWELLRY